MLKLMSVFLLLLVGCSAVPETGSELQSRPAAELHTIADKRVGDEIEVEGQAYTIIDNYIAASGRHCKKLLQKRLATVHISCYSKKAGWYLRQPLTNASGTHAATTLAPMSPEVAQWQADAVATVEIPASAASTIPAATPAANQVSSGQQDSASEQGVVAERFVTVLSNENLWRFSRRVTGRAVNWQKIARYNDLGNAAIVRAGDQLNIPPDLAILADGG